MPADNNIFTILAAFKGNNYNDDFLEFLLSSEYPQRREELVQLYSKALED